jgi:outer membrane lipoprotein carrier protein
VLTALVILIIAAVGIPVRADSGAAGMAVGDADVDAVLTRLNTAYGVMQSFEAQFTQTSSGISFPAPLVQEGTLQVQKPNKLRWEFKKPNPRLFLSDGTQLWIVDEAERTCTHYSAMMESLDRFLAVFNGADRLVQHYKISLAVGSESTAGADTLKLVPKVPDGSVDAIYLRVDSISSMVTAVVTMSAFGDRTETVLQGIVMGKDQPAENFRWSIRPDFQFIEAG